MTPPWDPHNNNKYHLFRSVMGDPMGASVLDWGGNSGNLLRYSEGDIDEHNYTCVDVDQQAVQAGAEYHPHSRFVHWNKWSSSYNPTGHHNIRWPEIPAHDLVYSFSIFTHTSYEEFVQTVEWLQQHTLHRQAHSLLDIRQRDRVKWFYDKRVTQFGSCVDFVKYTHDENVHILEVYDNDTVLTNNTQSQRRNSEAYVVFYDMEWLLQNLQSRGWNVEISCPLPERQPFVIL